jgi:hypothetical protein
MEFKHVRRREDKGKRRVEVEKKGESGVDKDTESFRHCRRETCLEGPESEELH